MNHFVFTACVGALALLLPCLQGADARPDFSGTWEMDATRSDSARTGTAVGAVTLVIKQTPAQCSIETRQGGKSEIIVYKLDGSESEKPAQDNGPFQWSAKWEGDKLATETHRSINRSTVTFKELFSVDVKAKEMTVNRTVTVQHGYTMRGAKNYSSGTDVFVKAR